MWEKKSIDELAEVTSSKRISMSEYVEYGVPFWRIKEVVELFKGNNISTEIFIERANYEKIKHRFGAPIKDDIILTSVGTIGVPYIVKEDDEFYFKDGNLTWFRNYAPQVDPKFIYYWLQSSKGQGAIQSSLIGSAHAALTIENIKKLKINLPPLIIQQQIAAIVGRYDALLENYQAQVAALEGLAQELYREWFVRGRCPGAEAGPNGELPAGWEVKKLGEVIELKYGKALVAEDRIPGDFPVVGSSGVVDFHDEPLVNRPGIVVGRKGNVGSVFWLDKPFFPIDTAFYVESGLSQYYLFYNLQEQNFISGDSAVPGLNREQALSNKVVVPDSTSLGKFDQIISPIFKKLENLQAQITTLRATRDALLPRLLSGQLLPNAIPTPA